MRQDAQIERVDRRLGFSFAHGFLVGRDPLRRQQRQRAHALVELTGTALEQLAARLEQASEEPSVCVQVAEGPDVDRRGRVAARHSPMAPPVEWPTIAGWTSSRWSISARVSAAMCSIEYAASVRELRPVPR